MSLSPQVALAFESSVTQEAICRRKPPVLPQPSPGAFWPRRFSGQHQAEFYAGWSRATEGRFQPPT